MPRERSPAPCRATRRPAVGPASGFSDVCRSSRGEKVGPTRVRLGGRGSHSLRRRRVALRRARRGSPDPAEDPTVGLRCCWRPAVTACAGSGDPHSAGNAHSAALPDTRNHAPPRVRASTFHPATSQIGRPKQARPMPSLSVIAARTLASSAAPMRCSIIAWRLTVTGRHIAVILSRLTIGYYDDGPWVHPCLFCRATRGVARLL